MKTFDWRACFKKHPVFWDLAEDELARLLDDALSQERVCAPSEVIIREGDMGDSVFLIGEGEVSVLLEGDREPGTPLATLGPGEFFGEMAVLERRPRMATVIAEERCTLLEISGAQFRKFLIEHPEIEFKMAAKLSHRLRDLTEHVLTARFKDVDQKLALFNNKLDSELKVIDASMKATQAVFDQTNKRANEIIESAERSRSRLTATITTITGVIGVLITVLGFVGIQKLGQLDAALEKYAEIKGNMNELQQTTDQFQEKLKMLEPAINALSARAEEMESLNEKVKEAEKDLRANARNLYLTAGIPKLKRGLEENSPESERLYREMMEQDDSEITIQVFKVFLPGLLNSAVRETYFEILENSIEDGVLTDEQEVIAYYLVLSTEIIAGMEETGLSDYYAAAREFGSNGGSVKQALERDLHVSTFIRFVESAADDADTDQDKEKLMNIWSVVP